MANTISESKKSNKLLAAPQRIRCRDAEWVVKKAEIYDQFNKYQKVTCLGLDPLVKNQERIFIEPLDSFEVIDPKTVKLMEDSSNGFKKSLFFLEARLRSLPQTGDTIDWQQLGVFRPYEFQKQSARLALSKTRARLLIADGVGLGKTIQIGMILADLIRRGLAERILVLSKKAMLTQFQSELWNKFNIPLVRMDSEAILRLRAKVPANKNPFDIYHRVIISLDTLKQKGRYEHFLTEADWDVVVIDEAHNIAGASMAEANLSNRLARLLAARTEHLILTTATPHNGKRETFGRLLSLVDPSSMPDPEMREYAADDVRGHFLMRFKEDVREEIGDQMMDRIVIPVSQTSKEASNQESVLLEKIADLRSATKSKKGKKEAIRLLQYGYYKLFLSSPEALKSTIGKRIRNLTNGGETAELSDELAKIIEIEKVLSPMALAQSTRYQILKDQLKLLSWDAKESSPRILIFTEYRETQKYLTQALAKDFKIKYEEAPESYADSILITIDGSTPDTRLGDAVEAFATTGTKVRLLIATDVASEGINLHHACHLVIHYDLPWSVITLIQRNGRIDRIGQTVSPEIRYLQIKSEKSEFANDEAIFSRLVEKVEEINRLRKEGETVLNLFDAKKEEEYIGEQIVSGASPDAILATPAKEESEMEEEFARLLKELMETNGRGEVTPIAIQASDKPLQEAQSYLYSDREFFIKGYEFISQNGAREFAKLEINSAFIGFTPPEEVKKRLGSPEITTDLIYGATSLPREVWLAVGNQFRLSDEVNLVETAILAAKAVSGHWSKTSYLNRSHPIVKWLVERLLLEFSRGEATMIVSPHFPKEELLYFFMGQVSSRAGYPILVDPHAVLIRPGGAKPQMMTLAEGFAYSSIANLSNVKRPPNQKGASLLLSKAVEASLEHLGKKAQERIALLADRIREETRRLNQWKKKRIDLIDGKFKNINPTHKEWAKWEDRKKETENYYAHSLARARDRFEQTADPITDPVLVIEGVK
jgi:ERCC4-related helicase